MSARQTKKTRVGLRTVGATAVRADAMKLLQYVELTNQQVLKSQLSPIEKRDNTAETQDYRTQNAQMQSSVLVDVDYFVPYMQEVRRKTRIWSNLAAANGAAPFTGPPPLVTDPVKLPDPGVVLPTLPNVLQTGWIGIAIVALLLSRSNSR